MGINQDFIEKVVLLLLTAILTGFLIPYILKQIEQRKLKEQKKFEADLARQNKIIEAQAEFMDNLVELLWEFQLSIIDVSFFQVIKRPDLYSIALKKYEAKAGETIGKIRAEISKAIRLTSINMYEKLKKLYYEELLPSDAKLLRLVSISTSDVDTLNEWKEFNNYAVHKLSKIVDETINHLAAELRLKESILENK